MIQVFYNMVLLNNMQKYIALRIHTALYLSVFFLALHYVFVYFANSSILRYMFNLSIPQVLVVYGIASLFGIIVYLTLSTLKVKRMKSLVYLFTFFEMICLSTMYYASTHSNVLLFIIAFCIHHIITPYILYNLDTLFESYTHIEDRGRGRGIYLTMWNTPYIVVPLILSGLNEQSLPIVYLISLLLLFPFLLFVVSYLQEPDVHTDITDRNQLSLSGRISDFWRDTLNRNSFITQSILHLYYGITGVLLPIYLHSYFGFEWNKIGILLSVTLVPFVLFQIPFGSFADKNHNERKIFLSGVCIATIFTIVCIFIKPETPFNFLYLALFLFISRMGCSLIEISMEGLFYKHVTERDTFALMMFRGARLVPYAFGLLAFFFI